MNIVCPVRDTPFIVAHKRLRTFIIQRYHFTIRSLAICKSPLIREVVVKAF